MSAVARRAGVVRATIYVHFPTREALLEAVTHRAVAEVAHVIGAARPNDGAPADALARVVKRSWRTLGRYHALVAVNTQQARARGAAPAPRIGPADKLEPLIERGQPRREAPAPTSPSRGI